MKINFLVSINGVFIQVSRLFCWQYNILEGSWQPCLKRSCKQFLYLIYGHHILHSTSEDNANKIGKFLYKILCFVVKKKESFKDYEPMLPQKILGRSLFLNF